MADLALQTDGELHFVSGADALRLEGTVASGVTFTAGTIVTLDSSGYVVVADANVAALTRPLFMALTAATTSNTGVTLLRWGEVNGFDVGGMSFGDITYLSATAGKMSDVPINVPQVQTVAIGGTLTGGHWHITFDGQTTGNIAHNANAAAIQAALEALANVGSGNVIVAGAITSFTITFVEALTGDNPLVTVDTSALTTSDAITSSVTDTTPGIGNVPLCYVVPSRTKQSSNEKRLLFCVGTFESIN